MKSVAESIVSLWCGTPPADPVTGMLGWLLIAGAGFVVAIAAVQLVRMAWNPREEALDHPKRSIFEDGWES